MLRKLKHLPVLAALCTLLGVVDMAEANEQLPWGTAQEPIVVTPDSARAPLSPRPQNQYDSQYGAGNYGTGDYVPGDYPRRTSPYQGYENNDPYAPQAQPPVSGGYDDPYGEPAPLPGGSTVYDRSPPAGGTYRSPQPYQSAPPYQPSPYQTAPAPYPPADPPPTDTYSSGEIVGAGHRFFGKISSSLASVIEYAFSKAGRPNGYILGEDAGGAFIAGLRYGEGALYTKNAGVHKVYWQGPSLGYDFGAEGSKTMILVYNLRRPSDIYTTFGGIGGQAYLVGGVGITFQANGDLKLAPIRSGIGLRLGANVGYLKYTRHPTWNPF